MLHEARTGDSLPLQGIFLNSKFVAGDGVEEQDHAFAVSAGILWNVTVLRIWGWVWGAI